MSPSDKNKHRLHALVEFRVTHNRPT